MLVIYSYKVLTVDHVYRYLLLKGLNLALWVESVTTPREEVSFIEPFESLVSHVVGLSYTLRFSRGVRRRNTKGLPF